jgi:hypothetical protein
MPERGWGWVLSARAEPKGSRRPIRDNRLKRSGCFSAAERPRRCQYTRPTPRFRFQLHNWDEDGPPAPNTQIPAG